MKTALALVILLLTSLTSLSQDIRVRQEAVHLLERGNAVTTPVKLPDLERIDSFRVFGPDQAVKDGTFTRVVIQGTGRRDETTLGDYHLVDVIVNGGMSRAQSQVVAPPEVKTLMRVTPIYHVSFNNEDVIHAIANREVNGQAARCIEFDTVVGQKSQPNEICVDAATGAIVLEKLNEERIEYQDFFLFAGALIPARIDYSSTATASMEIKQTMTVLTETIPNVLVAPPDAVAWVNCQPYRRAFGQSMPQPKPGNGGSEVDVVVRGVISEDGRVHDAVIDSSERPDLNAEALQLIHQWVFTPPMCNNQPTSAEASFTLHFQGR
ncbi:MAG: energy transducer TonB [Terriglobales bacterium]